MVEFMEKKEWYVGYEVKGKELVKDNKEKCWIVTTKLQNLMHYWSVNSKVRNYSFNQNSFRGWE